MLARRLDLVSEMLKPPIYCVFSVLRHTSGDRSLRIYCGSCGAKGRIASREQLSSAFTKLYCQCLDPACGHTFVMNLTYSHSLRPPAGSGDQFLFDRLRELPAAKQRELFDQLGALPS